MTTQNLDLTYSDAQVHMFFESESLGRFRIFPKGRRLGATRGASQAFIEWMLEGQSLLWGDTINSNIDRYVDRYFKPVLTKNNIPYNYSAQKKLLEVGTGYTDFRSADRPENWEGFGYNKIFLNEAGIILNSEYLYNNAVLPMMLDHGDSQLIAAGTPKLLRGKGRFFFDLWQRAQRKEFGCYGKVFTTYDNPFLTHSEIEELEKSIPANERRQEIYGEFIEEGGNIIQLSWFGRYDAPPIKPNKIIQSWDTAYKPKQINDPSVCTTWAITDTGYYLIDVMRAWLDYPALKRMVNSLYEKYNPSLVLIEDKASGQSLLQELRQETKIPTLAILPEADKITRMSDNSTLIEGRVVFLPKHASWLPEYEMEIASFPQGDHDDQVDSTSQFLNWVKKPAAIPQVRSLS